jgi:hypothetical protein
MHLTRRFGLVVVLGMVAALLAGTSGPGTGRATAATFPRPPDAIATLYAVGDEPDAWGSAALSLGAGQGWKRLPWTLRVTCLDLTPHAKYYFGFPGGVSATSKANADGTWAAEGRFGSAVPTTVWVVRADPITGNTLVLHGTFVWYRR